MLTACLVAGLRPHSLNGLARVEQDHLLACINTRPRGKLTCFTGTKVQLMTPKELQEFVQWFDTADFHYRPADADDCGWWAQEAAYAGRGRTPCSGTQFTCFSGTKVQILTAEKLQM